MTRSFELCRSCRVLLTLQCDWNQRLHNNGIIDHCPLSPLCRLFSAVSLAGENVSETEKIALRRLLVLLPWSFADLQRTVGVLQDTESSSSSSCADDLLNRNDFGLRVASVFVDDRNCACLVCRNKLTRLRGPWPRISKAYFCNIKARIPWLINKILTLIKTVELVSLTKSCSLRSRVQLGHVTW